MVRLAQDFAMRYPLIDGQGNFGSIDGDAAAAMRYTEARMATAGLDLLADIDRSTVDFAENFDGSLSEPSVLPASFPNLIVNGSSGIAVGMSTSIPPHNLGEVCDALIYMLDHWESLDSVGLSELMQFIKGPDFPTGGLVFRYSEATESRLKAVIEHPDASSTWIVLPDIPGSVDQDVLVEQIVQATSEPGMEAVLDVRTDLVGDQSQVVIEVDQSVSPDGLLEQLYQRVPAMRIGLGDNLAHAYATGRGKVVVQAKVHIEALDRNRNRIIITELPYQVNKTALIERIAELARDARIEGLTDLRDESDRQGLRIVIDLTRTVDPYEVLAALYKLTPMRQTFSIIMLALVDNEPRLLSLKQALRVYLEHRFAVVRRRSEFELERARERAHILEGYLIALNRLDEVIETIRRSRTPESAHENLRKRFGLSDAQAGAVLAMPLRRLAALERKKIEDEYKDRIQQINFLEQLLASPKMMRELIKEELGEVKGRYADPRRTVVVEAAAGEAVTAAELVPDEQTWITLTDHGLLSRTFGEDQPQVLHGKKADPPRLMIAAGVNEILYLFTADGMATTLPVHQIPQTQQVEDGTSFASLAPLRQDQQVVVALTRPSMADEGYLFLCSVGGMVKRIAISDLPGLSARPFRVMGLAEDDALGGAAWTNGNDEVFLVSAEGKAIRFREDEVRPMGLPAAGVNGMKLGSQSDLIIGMMLARPATGVWVITTTGLAKSSPIEDFPLQGRYGQGVIAVRLADKSVRLAGAAIGMPEDTVVVVTNRGRAKPVLLGAAPRSGRNTAGSSVIALGPDEYVFRVALPRGRSMPVGLSASPQPEEEVKEFPIQLPLDAPHGRDGVGG